MKVEIFGHLIAVEYIYMIDPFNTYGEDDNKELAAGFDIHFLNEKTLWIGGGDPIFTQFARKHLDNSIYDNIDSLQDFCVRKGYDMLIQIWMNHQYKPHIEQYEVLSITNAIIKELNDQI